MSGWISRLLGRPSDRERRAELVLGVIDRILEGAQTVAEARARLRDGAERGDLDDVISWANTRDERVRKFIEGG